MEEKRVDIGFGVSINTATDKNTTAIWMDNKEEDRLTVLSCGRNG